jgi:hypothetical protein
MSDESVKANNYFIKMTQKVYIETNSKIESFEEYLAHRYNNICYYYSGYALMGLKPNDFLVRGYINYKNQKNFHHGWVEFQFNENEYIFDSLKKNVLVKQDWYELFNPRINYKKSQKEILDEYLNEKCAFKIQDGFWQFKRFFKNYASYSEAIVDDNINGHVPTILMLARLEMNDSNSEIKRFIAYS